MNDQTKINALSSRAISDNLERRRRPLSNYEVVLASIHRIMNLTKQNYTDRQITEIFARSGVPMKLETFVRHYKRAAAEIGSPLRRGRGRRQLFAVALMLLAAQAPHASGLGFRGPSFDGYANVPVNRPSVRSQASGTTASTDTFDLGLPPPSGSQDPILSPSGSQNPILPPPSSPAQKLEGPRKLNQGAK